MKKFTSDHVSVCPPVWDDPARTPCDPRTTASGISDNRQQVLHVIQSFSLNIGSHHTHTNTHTTLPRATLTHGAFVGLIREKKM